MKHKKGFQPGINTPIPPPKDFDDFLARLSPETKKAILAIIDDDIRILREEDDDSIANGYLDKPAERERCPQCTGQKRKDQEACDACEEEDSE
jgi:hypothetical protein